MNLFCSDTCQFEASDDPLEKITTTEAIRVLVDYYHTSDYYFAAKAKVEEISQVVSSICSSLSLSSFCLMLGRVNGSILTRLPASLLTERDCS